MPQHFTINATHDALTCSSRNTLYYIYQAIVSLIEAKPVTGPPFCSLLLLVIKTGPDTEFYRHFARISVQKFGSRSQENIVIVLIYSRYTMVLSDVLNDIFIFFCLSFLSPIMITAYDCRILGFHVTSPNSRIQNWEA